MSAIHKSKRALLLLMVALSFCSCSKDPTDSYPREVTLSPRNGRFTSATHSTPHDAVYKAGDLATPEEMYKKSTGTTKKDPLEINPAK